MKRRTIILAAAVVLCGVAIAAFSESRQGSTAPVSAVAESSRSGELPSEAEATEESKAASETEPEAEPGSTGEDGENEVILKLDGTAETIPASPDQSAAASDESGNGSASGSTDSGASGNLADEQAPNELPIIPVG